MFFVILNGMLSQSLRGRKQDSEGTNGRFWKRRQALMLSLFFFFFEAHLDSFGLSKHSICFIIHSSIPALQYASMIAADFQLAYPETKVEL